MGTCKKDSPQTRYRAMRLLVFLARRAELGEEGMIPAIRIASGIGVSQHVQRETQRRVIRTVVQVARIMLRDQGAEDCLVANLQGYRLTCDRAEIRAYLGKRKRAGLNHLAEHHQTKRSAAMAESEGQGFLFGGSAGVDQMRIRWD